MDSRMNLWESSGNLIMNLLLMGIKVTSWYLELLYMTLTNCDLLFVLILKTPNLLQSTDDFITREPELKESFEM